VVAGGTLVPTRLNRFMNTLPPDDGCAAGG